MALVQIQLPATDLFCGNRMMIYIIYAVSILLGIIVTMLINRKEEREKEEIQTNPWIVSEYLSRIEKASVEILSQKKPVDQIIILWWGLDGLRLNEDGSTEWISRKKPDKKPEIGPVNQNVFYQTTQSMAQTIHPLDMRNMCQNTQAHIQALQDPGRICATAQMHQMQMQLPRPPLQMIYPYGYIPFPQYPYAQHYQGNLTGCCCNQTIF